MIIQNLLSQEMYGVICCVKIRINKLSLDTSEVIIDGEISSLTYSQKGPEKNGGTSLLSKIFK